MPSIILFWAWVQKVRTPLQQLEVVSTTTIHNEPIDYKLHWHASILHNKCTTIHCKFAWWRQYLHWFEYYMTTNGWYHTTYVSRKWLPQKFNWFFSLRRKCLLTYLHLPKSEEILCEILPDMIVHSRSCLLWDGVVDPDWGFWSILGLSSVQPTQHTALMRMFSNLLDSLST